MASVELPVAAYDKAQSEKDSSENFSEKGTGEAGSVDLAQRKLQEEEALEERIENDEATEEEYRVEEAYEVAIKVSMPRYIMSMKISLVLMYYAGFIY